MNFRNERRTPLRGAIPKCAATPRPGRTPMKIALGSDQLSSQPPFEATRTGQAFCHLRGTCWRGRWCVATPDVVWGPPDLPRRSGWPEAFSRASPSGRATRGPWISRRGLADTTSVVAGKTTDERNSRTSSTAWQSCRRPSSRRLTSSAPSRASSTVVALSGASIFGPTGVYLSQSRRTNTAR